MPTLYKHQEEVIKDNPSRILLAHSTGTGKTLTGISLANKNATTLLVVCPKMLKEKWQRDIQDHGKEKMVTTIMSKEEFKRAVKELPAFDCVLVDEAHYFAGIKSQLHKSLYWYMKRYDIRFRYLLTATPYLSTPLNIYALARLLGHEWNYKTFIKEYFWEVVMGHRVILKPKPNIEGKVANLVAEIGHIVSMDDALDQIGVVLPEQKSVVLRFTLTDQQVLAKQEHAYTQSTHIQQWTKEHQIENGVIYHQGDGGLSTWESIDVLDSQKTQALLDIAEREKKLIVFCRYRAQIEAYLTIFKHRTTFELHGDIKNRDEIIQQAEQSENCIIFIQSACSAGYELPSFRTVVFASLDFSYVNHEQAVGRNLRINKLAPNTYYYLVCEGVDSDVYDCIMKKQDFSFEIYNKNK